jgi:hypothetical protein
MQIRGKGNAFATGVGNWLVNVIFSQASPQGLAKLGWKYYFVFAVFNIVITFPTVFFIFKETKGVSLEEMDALFGETSVRQAGKEITLGDEKERSEVHV